MTESVENENEKVCIIILQHLGYAINVHHIDVHRKCDYYYFHLLQKLLAKRIFCFAIRSAWIIAVQLNVQ